MNRRGVLHFLFAGAVAAAVPPDPTDSDLLAALPSEVLYFVVRGRQR
jgi:hypothetical protein